MLAHGLAQGAPQPRKRPWARVVRDGVPDLPFLLPPGHANATFCPHAYGCRVLVVCEGQAILDVTDSELTVTVRVPKGRWLWLVSPEAGVPACGHPEPVQGPAVPKPVTRPTVTQPGCVPHLHPCWVPGATTSGDLQSLSPNSLETVEAGHPPSSPGRDPDPASLVGALGHGVMPTPS